LAASPVHFVLPLRARV